MDEKKMADQEENLASEIMNEEGISDERLAEAAGGGRTMHCTVCGKPFESGTTGYSLCCSEKCYRKTVFDFAYKMQSLRNPTKS